MARKQTPKKAATTVDKSKHVEQRNKIKDALSIRVHYELTEKQKIILDSIQDKNSKIIMIDGPAGTSKTWLAILGGLYLMSDKKISDMIYVRSAVESADSRLGYLKGDEETKLAPYMEPLYDKVEEFLPASQVQMLKMDNRIEHRHVGFLRGLSWNSKYITADECQNLTVKELKTLMTRLGKFSKLVLIGDNTQNDINGKSGFKKIFDIFYPEENMEHGIFCFKLGKEDIVRSGIVQYLIEKFEENNL